MDGVAEGGVVVYGGLFLFCGRGWEWDDIVLGSISILLCWIYFERSDILGRALLAWSRALWSRRAPKLRL